MAMIFMVTIIITMITPIPPMTVMNTPPIMVNIISNIIAIVIDFDNG